MGNKYKKERKDFINDYDNDEQRYLLNQDCLLMKYQRGNAMNEPLQIFRGKWADGLERLHQIIDKEVGWKNFRSFVSSNVHHDSETSIEVVKTHLNQCRIECTDLLDIDFGEKGSICIQRDQVELLTEKFRYFLYFESNIQPMMDIDF